MVTALLAAGELVVRLLARGLVAVVLSFAFVFSVKFARFDSLVLRKYLQTTALVFAALFRRLVLVLAFVLFAFVSACKYLCAVFVVSCVVSSWQLFACGAQFTFRCCQCGVGFVRAFCQRGCAASLGRSVRALARRFATRRSCKYLWAQVLLPVRFFWRRLFVVCFRGLASEVGRGSPQQASEQGAAPDRLQLRSSFLLSSLPAAGELVVVLLARGVRVCDVIEWKE